MPSGRKSNRRCVCRTTTANTANLSSSSTSLVDEVGEDENHPLASMMEVIGVLIEKYEDENVAELA